MNKKRFGEQKSPRSGLEFTIIYSGSEPKHETYIDKIS